jgi:Ca-activated chloride channel family protein
MMSDQNKENAQPSMEELLTLVLMGEADAKTTAQVEAALEVDPDLRARRDSMVHTLGLLKEAAPAAGKSVLGEARRKALRTAAQQQLQPRRWRSTPLLSAAAVLLLVGGVAYFNQDRWLLPESEAHVSGLAATENLGYSGERQSDSPTATLDQLGYVGELQDKKMIEPTQELGYVNPGSYKGPGDSIPPTRDRALRKEVITSLSGGTMPSPPQESIPFLPATPSAPSASAPIVASVAPNRSVLLADKNKDTKVSRQANDDLSALLWSEGLDLPEAEEILEDALAGAAEIYSANPSAGARFDDFEDGDIRARTEFLARSYSDRLMNGVKPRCIVFDGYGRRYVDSSVIGYLHPESPNESPRDMFFRYYGDHAEVVTKLDSMSTFAADVDTASYPLVRNYLVHGTLPPKQAIRTEEFVNYFDYELAAPTEGDFAVHLQAMPSLFSGHQERTLLSIGIKAREVLEDSRKPMNLVFVIDKSGSMAGERMELVKKSLELLVDQMRQDDTLGIVTFDSGGHIVLEPTSAKQRWKLREAIRNLTTGGSTNAAEGLELGYQMMATCFSQDRINRLVLASDGVANTGETDQERILQTVRAQAEAEVDLTTLGVGMGNHNDVFLEQLANKGDGSCHYIDDYAEAKRVLVEQFLGTMVTIARDVKIQVEFDDQVVSRWRQLGYENRSLQHADFRNDAIDAGEVGSGHEVTALYELETLPNLAADAKLVTVRLRWFPDGSTKAVEQEFQLAASAVVGRAGLAPARLRLAAVVAQYAEVLRRSFHARDDSYLSLRQEADKLVRELQEDSDVRELRDMIERTVDLARWESPQDELSMLMESMRQQQLQSAQLRLLGGESEESAILLAKIQRQNEEVEKRLLQLLEE